MLTNPVFISVIVLTVLSLARVHVIFALIMAAAVAGLMSSLSLSETLTVFLGGMGGMAETALSYILLGVFAALIGHSNITTLLINKLLSVKNMNKYMLLLMIAGLTCLSGNLIPVHIAFIPILIPPLLLFFNHLRLDRRAVASALTFGLKMPYILIPAGYGLIFHGILVSEITSSGLPVTMSQIPAAMAIPAVGMFVGLFVAIFISYRKPRDYGPDNAEEELSGMFRPSTQLAAGEAKQRLQIRDFITLFAIIMALASQIIFQSLVIGAMAGIVIMFAGRIVTLKDGEEVVQEGIRLMGAIAFVMLLASGYATVLKDTGAVTALVESVEGYFSYGKVAGAALLLLIGLVVTMGIGTSFGTVPILAAIFVPICMTMGFSPLATIALIGTAGALGDAGSPASDSTLGPTAGLNADGKHNHIWDTCVPTFVHYNISLFIFGIVAALIL